MTVQRLDHVNIVTAKLAETEAWFAELLGLEARDGPREGMRWLYAPSGLAVLHLNKPECWQQHDPDIADRTADHSAAGALHHVAFLCTGLEEVLGRLESLGAEYRINRPNPRLTQVFTRDPNNVLVELGFLPE